MENNRDSRQPSFSHERLRVYQSSVDFVEFAHHLAADLPTGHASLSDQLRRASVSISLNIAEGAGEYRKREKARFYRIAKRSATECAALLDILSRLNAVPARELMKGRTRLFEIVSMLTALVKSQDGKRG